MSKIRCVMLLNPFVVSLVSTSPFVYYCSLLKIVCIKRECQYL